MNPFDSGESEILEGFLCPICRQDLRTPDRLTLHVEKDHSEEDQDVLQTFKDIFTKPTLSSFAIKSRNRLLNRNQNTFIGTTANGEYQSNQRFNYVQEVGGDRDHTAYLKSIRTPRVERYATETNKLIIRLHKLLTDRPEDPQKRKQHEQKLVPWVEGNLVKLCPSCAKKFNIARRQHHCRLCGSVMCSDCSRYLNVTVGALITDPSGFDPATSALPLATEEEDPMSLRVCEHCLHLLENRKEAQDSRNIRPMIIKFYDRIQELKKEIRPDMVSYGKIVNKLIDGDSVFTLQDAGALRAKIGRTAEMVELLSKKILEIPTQTGSRVETLKKFIRLACIAYIKEDMLSLPQLPNEEELAKIQSARRMDTEMRIERERRMAAEAFERAEQEAAGSSSEIKGNTSGGASAGVRQSNEI